MNYTALDTPESIPTVFVEAWNNRDPDTLASIFDDDAEFVNVVGLWWHNRQAIRNAHAYGLTHIFNHSTLSLRTVRVKQLAPSIAVVQARMRLEGQTPVGQVLSPQVRTNIFSFVVHRTPAGWRCVSAHNTDVVPGVETNVVTEDGQLRHADYRERSIERGRKAQK